jgi:phosphopantetheinyl transferase (holo-ACP synthase)
MVGNDVVDLADRETAPLAMHPRFDERVFAAEELLWIRREGDPARRRWMLWAAKESAFKAAKRLDPSSSFSPRRVLVRLDDDSTGTVRLAERTFSVQVRLDRDVCHAVAWADRAHLARSPIVVSGVRLVTACEASPRLAARAFAAESVAAYLGIAASDLQLVKDGRLPRLRLHGRAAGLDVSLSHHGRFVAFACALDRMHGKSRAATTGSEP